METVAREARKGRHLLLTGPVGVGKSAVLEAALDRLLARQHLTLLHVNEHQAKGQFLELARGLLESGLLKPSALELDAGLDALDPAAARVDQNQARGQPAQHPRPVRRHRPGPARPPGPGADRGG